MQYFPIPNIYVTNTTKADYGVITLEPVLKLFDNESLNIFGTPNVISIKPPNFESLGLSGYLVLYETIIPRHVAENSSDYNLSAYVKDRALAYVNDRFSGILSRTYKIHDLRMPNVGRELRLLVENQGRVNYGNTDVEDFKVI